jgi:hypothetical protein
MQKQIRTQERETQNQLGNTKSAAHSSKRNTELKANNDSAADGPCHENKTGVGEARTKLVWEKRNPLAENPRPGGERKPNHVLCPTTTDEHRSDRSGPAGGRSPTGERGGPALVVMVPPKEGEIPASLLVAVPPEGRRCLVLVNS